MNESQKPQDSGTSNSDASRPNASERRATGRKAVLITTSIVGGMALVGVGVSTSATGDDGWRGGMNTIWDAGDWVEIDTRDYLWDRDDLPWDESDDGEGTNDRWTDRRDDTVSGSVTTTTVDASDVTSLEIDVESHRLEVEYEDVDEATLRATGRSGDAWKLERQGDALVVASPTGVRFTGRSQASTLVLPRSLRERALDTRIDVSTGAVDADLRFGELEVTVGAGAARLGGSAENVTASVSAGQLEIELSDVATADLDVDLGQLVAELEGSTPNDLQVAVGAGNMELDVPDDAYRIEIDEDLGEVSVDVTTSRTAENFITGSVDFGNLSIRTDD